MKHAPFLRGYLRNRDLTRAKQIVIELAHLPSAGRTHSHLPRPSPPPLPAAATPFFPFASLSSRSIRMAAYPFTSIEPPSARYFPFDVHAWKWQLSRPLSIIVSRILKASRPHRSSVLIGAHLYSLVLAILPVMIGLAA